MNKRITVSTSYGFRSAKLIASNGDWAVCEYRASTTLTHLPTGAIVARLETAAETDRAADAMVTFAGVARFDVQTFDGVRNDVACALEQHGLTAAWKRGEV